MNFAWMQQNAQQPMIKVSVGLKSTIVPKESEKYVREIYRGTEEEKMLVIVPYDPKAEADASRIEQEKIIQKLQK